ncbi:hypothetical protein FRACA_1450012 [Frankia canadensis]|uniref:Uncharacterized protein n=1 Tax=Frankia canadensis TaxID=1836972 RepID=A0A2I2KLM1_9ACTN|nr:hypothetical protein FRACA_1450012 [Frankia canadensis]SOU53852.1 hypothetical protein FRACA_1450012 [Frankia canadensis]
MPPRQVPAAGAGSLASARLRLAGCVWPAVSDRLRRVGGTGRGGWDRCGESDTLEGTRRILELVTLGRNRFDLTLG